MQHRQWIALSGFVWLAIGCFLFYKGLRWIAMAVESPDSWVFHFQGAFGSPQRAANALMCLALVFGLAKGRLVLSKTVGRMVSRISALTLPIHMTEVYSTGYWVLIGCMMLLGFLLKVLPISFDVRGFIDVAVGCALIQGAIFYFRAARNFVPFCK